MSVDPGPRPSAIVRTRLIDDHLEELAQKVGQVVILGAGYDTRPYRLSCLASPRVFEVDHPALRRRNEPHSAGRRQYLRLVFVPVDFETHDLAGALRNARYAADNPRSSSGKGHAVLVGRGCGQHPGRGS